VWEQFLHLAAGAAALPAVSRIARAQTYPSRPVRIIVGYPPGGSSDFLARIVGQRLSERLGQPFVIENRPGAGSNIGTESVVRSAPDGYTLLLVGNPNAVNATLYEKLNYNFIRDITPVATISHIPFVAAVPPSFPAKTLPEFIAYAKENPGKVNIGSAGNGAGDHMSGELFKMMTGVNMVHVPYRGSAPALTDLIGAQVQVMFATMPASIQYIRAGKLRALAVTTATRSEALPDIPAVNEFVAGYESLSHCRLSRASQARRPIRADRSRSSWAPLRAGRLMRSRAILSRICAPRSARPSSSRTTESPAGPSRTAAPPVPRRTAIR
jgi:tripartite-type tricarboxylate transporter receptor subunit TctC